MVQPPQPFDVGTGDGFDISNGGAALAPLDGLLDSLPSLMFNDNNFLVTMGNEFKSVDNVVPMEHTITNNKGGNHTLVFTLDPQLMQSYVSYFLRLRI